MVVGLDKSLLGSEFVIEEREVYVLDVNDLYVCFFCDYVVKAKTQQACSTKFDIPLRI